VSITFAGTLGLNRAFVIEQDKGAWPLVAGASRPFGHLLRKMLGNLLFMLVVEIILLPLVMIFYNLWC